MKYVFLMDLGANKEGDVVEMDEAVAAPLVESGVLAVYEEEDKDDDETEDKDDDQGDDEKAAKLIGRKIASKLDDVGKGLDKRFTALERKLLKAAIPSPAVMAAEPKEKIFKNIGDHLRCMYHAAKGDNAARRKLALYEQKTHLIGTDASGGYAVPEEWAAVWDKAREYVLLTDDCKKFTASGDKINVPTINDTSRVTGSRPLRYYAVNEENAPTESTMAVGTVGLTPAKFGVLATSSLELLNDANSNFQEIILDQIGKEIAFCLNDQVVNAASVGLVNAASVVTISKESAQAAGTVLFANIRKMFSRLYAPCRKNAKWLVNQAVHAELLGMAFTTGGATPAMGLTYNATEPYPMRLFGCPVVEVEQCSALGTAGDVILADLSNYGVFMKPINIAFSDQFYFTSEKIVYKGTVRYAGASLWSAALTPFKGSQTVGHIIVTESRGTV